MRALVLLSAWAMVAVAADARPAFKLVVHPANPSASLEKRFVTEAFLKKTTRWADGTVIRPVDLRKDSAVRARFSLEALGRSVAAVGAYWEQLIFSGRGVPPPELEGDDEVLRYVLKHEGAIGYVSADAVVGEARVVGIK